MKQLTLHELSVLSQSSLSESDEASKDGRKFHIDVKISGQEVRAAITKAELDQLYKFEESLLLIDELVGGDGDLSNDNPPAPSGWIVEAVLPPEVCDDFLANMEELFRERWVPRYGLRKATWIWRAQCAQMILRQWMSPVLDILAKVKAIGTG